VYISFVIPFVGLLWFVAGACIAADMPTVSAVKIARVKYSGGGDWYNDPSAEVNLLRYVAEHTNIAVDPTYEYVDLATDNLFLYPVVFMTGHGTVALTETERAKLRAYLMEGGFLYVDDDYGMDATIRPELAKIFPGQTLTEIPFSHPLFSVHFSFPNGVPKIHEHDAKPARCYGLQHNGKLVVLYTVETNPSDGWADPEVHNNPPGKREEALQFGTNIIVYALTK
jgi:hypothetical protein